MGSSGQGIFTAFETFPLLAWGLVAAVVGAIALEAVNRRLRWRRELLAGKAVLNDGAVPWQAVLRAEEEKARNNPHHDTRYGRIARAAHIIETPFGEDGEGLEWTASHSSEDEFKDMAEVARVLGSNPMADILEQSAELVAHVQHSPDVLDYAYDSPEYQAIVTQAKSLEDAFRAAGGVSAFREMVDTYLLKHYPWAG